jgi:hypothetical protein
MALGKLLNLGGIDNRPPKANQSLGKFRVARNVQPTPDGRIIPRYDASEIAGQPSNVKCVHNISQYGTDYLSLNTEFATQYKYALYRNQTKVPFVSNLGISPFFDGMTSDYPQSMMNYRKNNTMYYLAPYDGTMYKYDGVEVGYTGVHLPYIFAPSVNKLLATASSTFVRVVQHKFDWDGNEPMSQFVEFKISNNATTSANTYVELSKYSPSLIDDFLPNITKKSTATRVAGNATLSSLYITAYSLSVGMTVSGTGITAGSVITAITGFNSVTISPAPTVSGTSILTFSITNLAGASFPTQEFPKKAAGDIYYRMAGDATYDSVQNEIVLSALAPRSVIANNTNSLTVADSTLFGIGMAVFGASVPAGTVIEHIPNATTIEVSNVIPVTGSTTISFEIDTNIGTEHVGAYVVTATPLNPFYLGLPDKATHVAFKIKSASPLTLDCNVKIKTLLGWEDAVVVPYTVDSVWKSYVSDATRTFLSFWTSTSSDGSYFLKSMDVPSFPESFLSYSTLVDLNNPSIVAGGLDTTRSLFIIGPNLNDIYDVNTTKFCANIDYDFGGNFPNYCFAVYQGQLLLGNDNQIWLSDTTLGGSFEGLNQSLFITIGDREYGRITSVCGTQDFFVVTRERKNYYVNGNIATGNYRTQEITGAETGAWSNTAAILVKDNVVFINSIGVFSVGDGGSCSKLSETCPKNFDSFDNNNVNEDVSFRLTGFVSYPEEEEPLAANLIPNDGIAIAYDEFRELLVFMLKSANNPCLVLNTRNKEFYEWDGMMELGDIRANTISFIKSKFLLGGCDYAATNEAIITEEDKTASLSYVTQNPIKLYTSWLTAGEPSLEKNLLQFKMFGRIQSNSTNDSINVAHYKDWNIASKVTNSPYFPSNTSLSLDNQTQYSHKKRLNSDKVLSASVGFEVDSTNVLFEIESIEVEFTSIQEGMKK